MGVDFTNSWTWLMEHQSQQGNPVWLHKKNCTMMNMRMCLNEITGSAGLSSNGFNVQHFKITQNKAPLKKNGFFFLLSNFFFPSQFIGSPPLCLSKLLIRFDNKSPAFALITVFPLPLPTKTIVETDANPCAILYGSV